MRTPSLVIAALTLLVSSTATAQTLTFGVVPQQAAAKLARLWVPLLTRVSSTSGVTLRFATAPDIPTFEKRLARGEYAFAYMNPYHFTVFNETPGYRAVARAKDKKIRGVIVVHRDSQLASIHALQGTTLAFPAPAAFAATVLPRATFRDEGIAVTPAYVSSHDSVYRAVAMGLYPAGGGVVRTLANAAPEVREQLKVLWTTRGYTAHAIAVHPRVPDEVVAAVREALLDLDASDEGRVTVEALKIKGFVAARDEDWDDVRALDLEHLDDMLAKR